MSEALPLLVVAALFATSVAAIALGRRSGVSAMVYTATSAASLILFLFGLTHLVGAAAPLTKTLPVGLADSYASMRLEIGSAYTLIFLFMIVPLLVAMQWASARSVR